MHLRIAIVEDEDDQAERLEHQLRQYGQEKDVNMTLTRFNEAVTFLDPYKADYDLIFMDIEMPYMNGMDAAHRLRQVDPDVLLIFVTRMTQYAIQGYEVNALDYMVKPVNYFNLGIKMARVTKQLGQSDQGDMLMINTGAGLRKLNLRSIYYVEVQGHHLVYHTDTGEYTQYSSMAKLEHDVEGKSFARCNSCYLVNLKYVEQVQGYDLILAGQTLKISQTRKKTFIAAWEAYNSTRAN